MSNKKKLLALQVCVFLIVSLAALVIGYHFPNLPPGLRALLPKGSKGIVKLGTVEKAINPRFLKWFNRDPDREIPSEPNIIVSPADGIVWDIKIFKDGEKTKHVVIEMRYTDVHVQRVPMDAEVICIEGEGNKIQPGALIKDYMLEKMMPFQKATTLKTEIGNIRVRQITSLFAERIEVYLKVGQTVKRGDRLGRVLAGSTVVLEVPGEVSILVKKNEDVIGGETIIGRY